jgi:hypothetical protein
LQLSSYFKVSTIPRLPFELPLLIRPEVRLRRSNPIHANDGMKTSLDLSELSIG